MLDVLARLEEGMEQIVLGLGYPGLALLMFLENLVPPIPSEIVLPLAGALVARGEMSLTGVLTAATLGAMAGAVVFYWIGRRASEPDVREWLRTKGRYLLLREEDYDRVHDMFEDHGGRMVFFGRMIPTVRSLISLPAGAVRMAIVPFLALSILGTLLWNGLLAGAGYELGRRWQSVLPVLERYEDVLTVAAALAIAWLVWRRVG